MAKILEVEGLRKSYGGHEAVKGIDFDVEAGSFFAFLGQNGAGKSTTIGTVLGLLKADGGSIRYDEPAEFRRQVGVVFQHNVFDDLLTVRENLMLYGRLYGGGAGRCAEIEERLSLGGFANQRFGSLSGGQKRRAEIARALWCSPRLLFLDEPTAGLDPKTRTEVWQLLHELRGASGMTIFLTTHYMEEVAGADKVVIIHEGRKVAEGSPAELKAAHSSDRLVITPYVGSVYAVEMAGAGESIDYLCAHRGEIRFFEAVRGSMDEVFLNAVGEGIDVEVGHE